MGLAIAAVVHSACSQDRDDAKPALLKAKAKLGLRMKKLRADGVSADKLLQWVTNACQWVWEIVKRSDANLPKCSVVERTFPWPGHYRRLDRHCEC